MYNPTHFYISMCKMHTNSKQTSIIGERIKQMLIVLNYLAVLYSILIGRKKQICQIFDQATALLESGQSWSQGPNFVTLLKASGRF